VEDGKAGDGRDKPKGMFFGMAGWESARKVPEMEKRVWTMRDKEDRSQMHPMAKRPKAIQKKERIVWRYSKEERSRGSTTIKEIASHTMRRENSTKVTTLNERGS